MRILITGGCGFLGSNLASHGINEDFEILLVDNLSKEGSINNLKFLKSVKENLLFKNIDVRNYEEICKVVKSFRPKAIFHLAGQVAMTTSLENPKEDFEINTLGTLNVLEAVRKYSPGTRIIYSSTNKVYGDLNYLKYTEQATRWMIKSHPNGLSEDLKLDFTTPYGCSKGAADQYIIDYARIFGISTIVFRHSSMYGTLQHATPHQGWVGWFCREALAIRDNNSRTITIAGDGKQVRDLLHAEDMKKLYYKALTANEITCGQAYNVGGGYQNSLSLLELFEFLETLLGIKINVTKKEQRKSDQKVFIADNAKITEHLGWKPTIKYDEGIATTLKWLQAV